VEGVLAEHLYASTCSQRTAEWFLFRGFHLMATTASRILNSTAEVEEGRLLQLLLGSWFNRTRFTEQMRIGTKNEDAILAAFKNHSNVTDMFSCGLLELKHVPWLAASPNVIAVVKNPHGGKVLATVDMKFRVAPESITEAKTITAHWNNKLIVGIIGTDDAKEVGDKDHLTQVLIQMATCNLHWGVYIVGQAGTSNTTG
jgi:hypothetical protein